MLDPERQERRGDMIQPGRLLLFPIFFHLGLSVEQTGRRISQQEAATLNHFPLLTVSSLRQDNNPTMTACPAIYMEIAPLNPKISLSLFIGKRGR